MKLRIRTMRNTPGHPRRPDEQPRCAWCGRPITFKATGRTPKCCTATCRHRAWEQSQVASPRRSAVTVVDRSVELKVPGQAVKSVAAEVLPEPRGSEWKSPSASWSDRSMAVWSKTARLSRGSQHTDPAFLDQPKWPSDGWETYFEVPAPSRRRLSGIRRCVRTRRRQLSMRSTHCSVTSGSLTTPASIWAICELAEQPWNGDRRGLASRARCS